MSSTQRDLYALAPMQALLADESAALLPQLQRCAGEHGLLISASGDDLPPALPLLRCWTRLASLGGHYRGDLTARTDEPLPFRDDAFDLVLLRHALEVSPAPARLLAEATRVLAPGGALVITGLHPFSAWLPWALWHGGHQLALESRLQLGPWLRAAELEVERQWRVGTPWPRRQRGESANHLLGGGYLLQARKRRHKVIPLPRRAVVAPPAVSPGLAPGARRHATCSMTQDH